jgi:hypothetical protein
LTSPAWNYKLAMRKSSSKTDGRRHRLVIEVSIPLKRSKTDFGASHDFTLVCGHCRSLSIRYDGCEADPFTKIVRCGACNSVRGTFRGLQVLANSNRRDLFEDAHIRSALL